MSAGYLSNRGILSIWGCKNYSSIQIISKPKEGNKLKRGTYRCNSRERSKRANISQKDQLDSVRSAGVCRLYTKY